MVCGSSPRSWGTGDICLSLYNLYRFIPTLVGNGAVSEEEQEWLAVHPHARGERTFWFLYLGIFFGSSPRSWGTGGQFHRGEQFLRFIPTLVGNGRGLKCPASGPAVHPHARGERLDGLDVFGRDGGSSPRSWGTGHLISRLGISGRFIPTLVGNGPWSLWPECLTPVHPHARGERYCGARRYML